MKILLQMIGGGGNDITRHGQASALAAAGHNVAFWNAQQTPAFDVFKQFEPDLFIGMTYECNRAICKNIIQRPNMKVAMLASDWGTQTSQLDLKQFPVLTASPLEVDTIARLKEQTGKPDFIYAQYPTKYMHMTHDKWKTIGIDYMSLCNAWCPISYRQDVAQLELEAQISFIGGLWDYKRRNIFPYIFPLLHPVGKYNIKIYGFNHWGVPQYIGAVSRDQERQIFASSKICPNVSEPHSQVYGNDLVERPFKVMGNGQALCIGDYVEGFREFYKEDEFKMCKTPEEYEGTIKYFLDKKNVAERTQLKMRGQKATVKNHSYFHRMSDIFTKLNMGEEAKRMMAVYNNILEKREQLHLLED